MEFFTRSMNEFKWLGLSKYVQQRFHTEKINDIGETEADERYRKVINMPMER